MKATTPYAIGVAAAATWGLSPFAAGIVTAVVVAVYVMWKMVVRVLLYKGPTVIDPDSPPYKVDNRL